MLTSIYKNLFIRNTIALVLFLIILLVINRLLVPSMTDYVMFLFPLAFFSVVILFGVETLRKINASRGAAFLFSAFVLGMCLLYISNAKHNFADYSYDVFGHVEYIDTIHATWSIPQADDGWEFHQPPLYYAAVAAWWEVNNALTDVSRKILLKDVESLSWLMMTLSLIVSVWISCMLFPKTKQGWVDRCLFVLIIATFPALVFMANRISNDVPFHLIAVSFLAFLLRWWQQGKRSDFVIAAILVGLGLITKSTGLILLLTLLLSILLTPRVSIKGKAALVIVTMALSAILSGWYFGIRSKQDGTVSPLTLMPELHSQLEVTRGLGHYTVFNPLAISRSPFNQEWVGYERESYFWEFFYRSMFFGEWVFSNAVYYLAPSMVLIGVYVGLFGIFGLLISLFKKWREHLPLWLLLFIALGTLITYSVFEPATPNQDFRFISCIAIPMAFGVIYGIRHATNVLKLTGLLFLSISVLMSGVFMLLT